LDEMTINCACLFMMLVGSAWNKSIIDFWTKR